MFKPVYDILAVLIKRDRKEFKKQLQLALTQGFPIDYRPNDNSYRLLELAITDYGSREFGLPEFLINLGANPNKKDIGGMNALMLAIASYSSLELISFLVKRTEEINLVDNFGITALEMAVQWYLEDAITEKNKERAWGIIKLLLDNGADIKKLKKVSESPETTLYFQERNLEIKNLVTTYILSKTVRDNLCNMKGGLFEYEL